MATSSCDQVKPDVASVDAREYSKIRIEHLTLESSSRIQKQANLKGYKNSMDQ